MSKLRFFGLVAGSLVVCVLVIAFMVPKASTPGLSVSQSNNEFKWYDFNEGYVLASKQKKILLVDLYTDWCGWCKRMDKDTYAQPNVQSEINNGFIAVKLNPEKEGIEYKYNGQTYNGRSLMNEISQGRVRGFPSTVFLFPSENNRSEVVVGYKPAHDFMATLNQMRASKKQ